MEFWKDFNQILSPQLKYGIINDDRFPFWQEENTDREQEITHGCGCISSQ